MSMLTQCVHNVLRPTADQKQQTKHINPRTGERQTTTRPVRTATDQKDSAYAGSDQLSCIDMAHHCFSMTAARMIVF